MRRIWARQPPVIASFLVPLSRERRTQLGLFRSSPTMRSMPAMPGLAPQGPHATIGVSIQPTTSGPGQAWVRYPGERALRRVAHSVWAVPSSGSIPRSQRMPRRRLSSRRSASWNTASCWISLGQLCAKSRPSAANCSTSLMVVVLTTRTISMKAAAFFVEALLARARRTRGRSARVLRQDGARGLSPRIGSQ